jgi:hypothetical protein
MHHAARALVAEKDAFDEMGRKIDFDSRWEIAHSLIKGLAVPAYGWTAVSPSHFIRAVLPFSTTDSHRDAMRAVSVDSRLIVAGTYNDYSPSWFFTPVPPEQRMAWSDGLTSEENKYSRESPRACQIGNLPLFVALEGKNRVTLFKQHKRPMLILVTQMPYPAASELKLFRSSPFGIYSLAYRGQREVLPFPKSVVPLLQKYGVEEVCRHLSVRDLINFYRVRRSICRYQMQ